MKALNYGKGYRYAHDDPGAVTEMSCLPPALQGRKYYQPAGAGADTKATEDTEKTEGAERGRDPKNG
jgi:putative ATPase